VQGRGVKDRRHGVRVGVRVRQARGAMILCRSKFTTGSRCILSDESALAKTVLSGVEMLTCAVTARLGARLRPHTPRLARLAAAEEQGLTLVHFSAQVKLFKNLGRVSTFAREPRKSSSRLENSSKATINFFGKSHFASPDPPHPSRTFL